VLLLSADDAVRGILDHLPDSRYPRPMPRLTDDQHYERYLILRRAWSEMTQLYSALLLKGQAAIHAYYQPSKDLTPEALAEHRRQVTKERPGLPAAAGKAYKLMLREYERLRHLAAVRATEPAPTEPAKKAKRVPRGQRNLRITSVLRPEPDLQKIVNALIEMAMEMQRKDEAERNEGEPRSGEKD
jgi:hypothetical protein